jgi:TfoX/Sxy family transcriptional regulator of competence genes
MEKPSDDAIARFQSVAPGGPEAEGRKMFGQPCALVHGNLFMGLFGDLFQVRLSPEDRRAALEAGAVPFEPMGRAMKEYVVLPEAVVREPAQLQTWVDRAYAYACSLPVKQPRPRAPKARSTGSRKPAARRSEPT